MTVRKIHKLIGLALMLPFLGWVVTGFIFFFKPGYENAYAFLAVRTYPLDESIVIGPDSTWLEFKYLRTILGDHLLVKTDNGWKHFNPQNMQPMPDPVPEDVEDLVADAIQSNPGRYGEVHSIDGLMAKTTTGVEISLDWKRLSLQQRGKDTDRIDWFYKIHYLQWTGVGIIDKVLGFLGLALVATLTVLGARLAIKGNQKPS